MHQVNKAIKELLVIILCKHLKSSNLCRLGKNCCVHFKSRLYNVFARPKATIAFEIKTVGFLSID